MQNQNNDSLKKHLLFTRPQGQGEEIVSILKQAGWQCERQPLLSIHPITAQTPKPFQAIKQRILDLCDFDFAISVSSNAATLAVDWIDQYWPQIPTGIQWLAVGPSSAAPFESLLKPFGLTMEVPSQNHSEGLLALEALQNIEGKKVLIFRGVGGRELLAQTLTQRGAVVQYCELYERKAISFEQDQLANLLRQKQIHYALLLSVEMAQQLAKQFETQPDLFKLHMIVPSQRIAQACEQLGFGQIHVCPKIQGQALLDCLENIHNQ